MLFLLYINDINYKITSQIKLFADSVMYRNIRSQNDKVILQNDLDTISSWVEKWLMELSINKCSVLSITIKRNSNFHDCNILGATPKQVTNHDYLGVTISSDLICLGMYNEYASEFWNPYTMKCFKKIEQIHAE